jgi:ABC-type transport system involved in multi-copper enzyme maturation permease subunit
MSQTLALIWDAYRDLNSRKMFWIVLILSTLVAASFAAIGLTPTGFKIFFWKISSPILNSREMPPGDFYKGIFLNYGIEFWLTWLATVLALISTASIFPDFIATGAVDLYLSKPISRLRLFLTKYLCGLLFVALQIGCFCAASFAVIGLRGGAWEPGIFLAVPIVLLFFSYLFCFCGLIGVWMRSTVAAVLLTFLYLGAHIRRAYDGSDASDIQADRRIRGDPSRFAN